MAIEIPLQSEPTEDLVLSQELEALQAILAAQGNTVSGKETAEIGYGLLDFFEALGEYNESIEESDA